MRNSKQEPYLLHEEELMTMKNDKNCEFISTFLVTAALNETDMEVELSIEDPEDDVAFAAITNSILDK